YLKKCFKFFLRDNEAAMIEKIATDVSAELLNNAPSSSVMDGYVGMRAHMAKMKQLLCLDSNEVRMIGILGPSGIGRSARLWSSVNGEIECVLKFSYDALCDEDKDLFIYIACFFNDEWFERVEEFLAEKFSNVRYGLRVLADKSLISIDRGLKDTRIISMDQGNDSSTGCTKLVSLPQLPDSLRCLEAENQRLDSSISSLQHVVNFGNCFKLNQEARELIIRTCRFAVLPGEQIPMYFLWQATGSSLLMKGNGMDHIPLMGCVLVVNKVGDRRKKELDVYYCFKDGTTSVRHRSGIHSQRFPVLNEHLYTFEIEEKEVCCGESSVFEFEVRDKKWEVRECGLNLVANFDFKI
ncbi:hypothetical protein HID58_016129, partial [Brassica napus]